MVDKNWVCPQCNHSNEKPLGKTTLTMRVEFSRIRQEIRSKSSLGLHNCGAFHHLYLILVCGRSWERRLLGSSSDQSSLLDLKQNAKIRFPRSMNILHQLLLSIENRVFARSPSYNFKIQEVAATFIFSHLGTVCEDEQILVKTPTSSFQGSWVLKLGATNLKRNFF